MKRKLLIVDDDTYSSAHLQKLLASDELDVDAVTSGQEALTKLGEVDYSILMTDLRMPGMGGMDLIREVVNRRLLVTIIVTTAFGSIDRVVEAMRLGAYDFLTKPINDPTYLRLVIDRALKKRALQDEVLSLRQQLRENYSFHSIISKNPRMHKIFELIRHIAGTKSTVLIEGETGTGKELIAKAIHYASDARGPLVAVNCAALPETLLESELFGHEKGAFTSAEARRKGRFELADGGTIFLDEIGDISQAMQAKLLRVLQERKFERVGGHDSLEVDLRVIAATNKSLEKEVGENKFREDLYYRLNVIRIDLPPLRERPEDIPLLISHFLNKYARPNEPPKKVSPEAMERMLAYRWPGNIRELENAIERAAVTTIGDTITSENLPPRVVGGSAPQEKPKFEIDLKHPLPHYLKLATEEIEKEYIAKALEKTRGNVGRCAELCGLSRRSISGKISQYGIDKIPFKAT
jgi:DNA-binding NtrC family response regulator